MATEDNPAAAYVLLRMARDMAAETGDADTALAAVEEMGRRFDISVPEAKAAVLDTAVKATHSPSGKKLLIEEMFSLIDEAVEVDDLKCREEPAKSALLKALGGTQTSETAVQLALEWLANHQRPDGSWNFNHDGPRCKGRCRNPGDMEEAPNSATALALLPFLGAGERPRGGKYRKNVFTAVQFLKKRMVALSPTVATLYEPRAHQMPSHALGTMALCEASFDDRDRTARLAAQAAVNFIVATQQDDGGWSWRPKLREGERGEPSGISATGWNLMALETAKWADLKVPAKTTEAVDRFLDSLQSQDKKAYSRQPNFHPDSQSTSVALFCRMLLGCPRDDSQIVEFVQTLGDREPGRRADLFAKYRNTLLMMNFGGPAWQKWNPVVRDSLIAEQSHADHEAGSWFMPGNGRNRHGGRLYSTAVATLILESYYRYPPFYSDD